MSRTPFTAQARIDTPLGPLTVAATADGLAGVWFDGQLHHPGKLDAPADRGNPHIEQAGRELALYWKQALPGGFRVALDLRGTPFQRRVWALLGAIASGHTRCYGDIAEQAGAPRAARAVGAAVGLNPVSIIVPCHRVVGRDGRLTGYAGGLDRKRALLTLEAMA